MARAQQGCLARRLSSSMGTLRLVHPDKQLRLGNRRDMTETLEAVWLKRILAHG